MLMNRSYKNGTYHVGRTDMWGNYCPETGEYYLARPEGVLASARYICDDEWQVQAYQGYSYEVVRELLQLGHLTSKTLARFIEEEGGTFGGISRIIRRGIDHPRPDDGRLDD